MTSVSETSWERARHAHNQRMALHRILASRMEANRPLSAAALLSTATSEYAFELSLPAFPFEDDTDV